MDNNRFFFSASQQRNALKWLVFWHIVVIVSSNYLVQIPFTMFGLHTTWGAFTFPFIFLTTDLTVRIFGARLARKIIFFTMLPALCLSYLISVLFSDGQFKHLSTLATFDSVAGRIVLASLLGYLIGQLLDIAVFNRLRQQQQWWLAPSASSIAGNAIDTFVFFFTAFYHSANPYMAAHWQEIALVDYAWKLIISGLLFLPAYGILLKILIEKLTQSRQYLTIQQSS